MAVELRQVTLGYGPFIAVKSVDLRIEKGEITRPIRAAQLIGNGPDVLRMVDAVGNDFDTWTGMCGKQGQSVPVSAKDTQPEPYFSKMTPFMQNGRGNL